MTREIHAAVVKAFGCGIPKSTTAAMLGLHPDTISDWLKRGEQESEGEYFHFFQGATRAHARFQAKLITVLGKASAGFDEVKTKETVVSGIVTQKEVTKTRKFYPELALEILARRDPEHWAKRDKTQLTDSQGGPPVIRIITGYEEEPSSGDGKQDKTK